MPETPRHRLNPQQPAAVSTLLPNPAITHGPDAENILALSPLPAPVEQSVKVPAGEARGRFVISPEPNLPAPGTGDTNGSEAKSQPAAGPSKSKPSERNGEGAAGSSASAPGAGDGNESNARRGEAGAAASKSKASDRNGNGAAESWSAGAKPATQPANASGATAEPPKVPFAGITIQGGRLEGSPANAGRPRAATPAPPQTSYALTIVSTANSGGGLPDYGVFSHEQVYTVYLDMRQTLEDAAPFWTLQYAVLQKAGSQQASGQTDEALVPPLPATKAWPELPPDLVGRYLRKLVVVFAILGPEGRLGQMSVRHTPDVQFKKPVLEALSKWVFWPAELNGEPIALKILLGIPIWLSE